MECDLLAAIHLECDRIAHADAGLAPPLSHHRLTLLVAPAGYRKTAALTCQIRVLPATEPHDLPWRVAPEAVGTLAQAERGLREMAYELRFCTTCLDKWVLRTRS